MHIQKCVYWANAIKGLRGSFVGPLFPCVRVAISIGIHFKLHVNQTEPSQFITFVFIQKTNSHDLYGMFVWLEAVAYKIANSYSNKIKYYASLNKLKQHILYRNVCLLCCCCLFHFFCLFVTFCKIIYIQNAFNYHVLCMCVYE